MYCFPWLDLAVSIYTSLYQFTFALQVNTTYQHLGTDLTIDLIHEHIKHVYLKNQLHPQNARVL